MRTLVAGLLAVSTLVVSGCSLPGGGSGVTAPATLAPPSTAATAAPSVTSTASTASTGDPSGSPSAPGSTDPGSPGPDQLGTPVGTRTTSVEGQRVVLTLYPVVRSGATSELNFTLQANVSKANKIQVADLLSDDNADTSDRGSWAADGLQLIDGVHSKVYLVASDGDGNCLCSHSLLGTFLQDNVPLVLSATFAAPPPDVTTVNVRVANFGTLTKVPVQ